MIVRPVSTILLYGYRTSLQSKSLSSRWQQRRTFITPRNFLALSKFASRSILGAAGATVATVSYYSDKLSTWGNDRLQSLGDYIKGIQLPQNGMFKDLDLSVLFPQSRSDRSSSGGGGGRQAQQASLKTGNHILYALSHSYLDDHNNDINNNVQFSPDESSSEGNRGNRDDDDNDQRIGIAQQGGFLMLTRRLLEVKNILVSVDHVDRFQLPSIVVIGSQSSGKSSLLEAIVGNEFLPKGVNMVTRRPIEITLINTSPSASISNGSDNSTNLKSNSNGGGEEYAEFPRQGLKRITDFKRVQSIIADLNMSVPEQDCVSDDPIDLRIYSPNVPDLTLIDLPGYIAVNNRNQPDELKQKIVELCRKYLKEPNIILAVSASDVDLANSEALNESRKVDPDGERTIGVLTKIDLIEPQKLVNLIQNQDYPLNLGYYGVMCKKIHSSVESQWLKSNRSLLNKVNTQVGIELLRRKLIGTLEQSMAKSLGSVMNNVGHELEEASYNFKVQYDDRQLSPEAYTTEVIDKFKSSFRKIMNDYGRSQIRLEIMQVLDQKLVDILQQQYYQDTSGLSGGKDDDDVRSSYNKHSLDRAHSNLSKSKIGKDSTQCVVDKILTQLDAVVATEPFIYHQDAVNVIKDTIQTVIKFKFHTSVEQVENTIKPYKYETDYTESEWDEGLRRSIAALELKLQSARADLIKIKNAVGGRVLKSAMQQVTSDVTDNGKESPSTGKSSSISPKLRQIAVEALSLQKQINQVEGRLYQLRSGWFVPSQCAGFSAVKDSRLKIECPEPYLFMIADKMAQTATMFIWVELLNELLYQVPREIDSKLYYSKSRDEIQKFANENPQVRKHLMLQRKKELLQTAMDKLIQINQSR
ncbi:hypothetical protein MIR68_011491 [Amoeboaphelidium protococcarum]|nr:hypothetical protein MIR68_011491 [Amoeboaphelidium protococcarum]